MKLKLYGQVSGAWCFARDPTLLCFICVLEVGGIDMHWQQTIRLAWNPLPERKSYGMKPCDRPNALHPPCALQGRLLGRRPGQSGGAAVRVWGIEPWSLVFQFRQKVVSRRSLSRLKKKVPASRSSPNTFATWWNTRYTPSCYASQYLERYVKHVKGGFTTSDGSRWRCRVTDFVSMGVSVKVHNLWTVAARSRETLGLKSLFERACWISHLASKRFKIRCELNCLCGLARAV